MTMDSDSTSTHPVPLAGSTPEAAGWGRALVLLILLSVGVGLVFYDTAESMVAIWLRSDTFAHGFLILPITLWLVWEKRRGLARIVPRPAVLPLALMVPVGFGWLLGHLVDVLVVQQFAFVAMLMLGAWSVMGTAAAAYLAFPLAFLLFAVPVGEGLIYPMMHFTADFTVGMLRLTGIPVFRDGMYFSIPSGDWSVVEACSGVRYLIASVTLGALYAYLTYTRLWKRLLFLAVSVVVPIIANGLRAYMIVMIAHLSDMKLAVGVDHLIYGWVFFGIIITILFFIGALWRDPPEAMPEPRTGGGNGTGTSAARAVVTAVAALAAAALWPGVAWTLSRGGTEAGTLALAAPAVTADWTAEDRDQWRWKPRVVGADGELTAFYRDAGGTPVGLHLSVYRTQRQGAELLGSQNVMAPQRASPHEELEWSEKEQTGREIRLGGESFTVRQSRISSTRTGEGLLVWHWYRVADNHTANPYVGKLWEAAARLSAGRRDGTLIVLATPYHEKGERAAEAMQAFLDQMLPGIDAEIDRALGLSP